MASASACWKAPSTVPPRVISGRSISFGQLQLAVVRVARLGVRHAGGRCAPSRRGSSWRRPRPSSRVSYSAEPDRDRCSGLSTILMRSPISLMTAAISLTIHSTSAMNTSQTSSTGLSPFTPEKSGGWNRFVKSDSGGTMMKSGMPWLLQLPPAVEVQLVERDHQPVGGRRPPTAAGSPSAPRTAAAARSPSSSSWNGRSSPCPVTSLTAVGEQALVDLLLEGVALVDLRVRVVGERLDQRRDDAPRPSSPASRRRRRAAPCDRRVVRQRRRAAARPAGRPGSAGPRTTAPTTDSSG